MPAIKGTQNISLKKKCSVKRKEDFQQAVNSVNIFLILNVNIKVKLAFRKEKDYIINMSSANGIILFNISIKGHRRGTSVRTTYHAGGLLTI